MRRSQTKKASAILSADMHLRLDTPEARTDDYRAAQARKVKFLADLQREHDCPILDAGDMFHKWRVEPELEGFALLNLPADIITVPGNHDLPNHSLALYHKSSLHVLEAAGKVRVLKTDSGNRIHSPDTFVIDGIQILGFPYGEPLVGVDSDSRRTVAIVHAYIGESMPPGVEGYTPAQLLAALPGFDLIVSGHNHVPLVYEHRGRVVVNPGSMMRMFADQGDMKPGVFLWYAGENTVERVEYPIAPSVVSREHIETREARTDRMDAFVARLDSEYEVGLSFEKNIEAHFAKNKTDKKVRELVMEAIG